MGGDKGHFLCEQSDKITRLGVIVLNDIMYLHFKGLF